MPSPVLPPVTLAGVVEVLLQVELVGILLRGSYIPLSQTCRCFRNVVTKHCRKFLKAEYLAKWRDNDEFLAALESVSRVTVVNMGDMAIAEVAVSALSDFIHWRVMSSELLDELNTLMQFRPVMNQVCKVLELFIEHSCIVLVCIEFLAKYFLNAKRCRVVYRFQSPEFMSLVRRTFERHMQDRHISENLILLCENLFEQDDVPPDNIFQFPVDYPVVVLRCLQHNIRNFDILIRRKCLLLLWPFNANLRHANVLVENGFIEFVTDVAISHANDPEIIRNVAINLDIACRGEGRTNAINRVRILRATEVLVRSSRLFSNDPFISNPINSTLELFAELGFDIPNT
jgi:hypothetical protein